MIVPLRGLYDVREHINSYTTNYNDQINNFLMK